MLTYFICLTIVFVSDKFIFGTLQDEAAKKKATAAGLSDDVSEEELRLQEEV